MSLNSIYPDDNVICFDSAFFCWSMTFSEFYEMLTWTWWHFIGDITVEWIKTTDICTDCDSIIRFLVRKLNKCLNCGFVVVSDLLYVYSKILEIPAEQTVYFTINAEIFSNSDDLVMIHDQTWTWKDRNGRRLSQIIEQVPARQATRFCSASELLTISGHYRKKCPIIC